jgi:hypothetical protein
MILWQVMKTHRGKTELVKGRLTLDEARSLRTEHEGTVDKVWISQDPLDDDG